MINNERIALCISGQPRFVEESFPYIKKNIIDCNENVDVFLHCWFSEKEAGKKFANVSDTTREEGIGMIKSDTTNLLIRLYNPVSYLIEPQEDFSTLVKPEYLAAKDKTNPFATFSMWESIKRCNNLKSSYELGNSFTYTAVIKCRFDLKMATPLIINLNEINSLNTSNHSNNLSIIEDIIFYTSSDVMNKVVELPSKLDTHFKFLGKWGNESLLNTHCISESIDVIRHTGWDFTLNRGKRSFIDTLWYYKRRIFDKLKI